MIYQVWLMTPEYHSCFSPAENAEFDVGKLVSLEAIASSGLSVAFTSLTTDVCVVGGATLITNSSGRCEIQVTQPGNEIYSAAPVVLRTVFVKKDQSISFPTPPAAASAEIGDLVPLSATANSGLEVIYSSLTPNACQIEGDGARITGGGVCRIEASQVGDDHWYAADPVTVSFSVGFEIYLPSVIR